MTWTIVSQTAPAAPITDDEARQQCRIETGYTAPELANYIDAARSMLETWLNRAATTTRTVVMTATDEADLSAALPIYPIASITSIEDADDADVSTVFTSKLFGKYPTLTLAGTWPGAITVTAVCGFGNPAAVPGDLKLAMLLAISTMYSNRGQLPAEFFEALDYILTPWRRQAFT